MKFVGIKNKDLIFEIDDNNGEYIIGRAEDCDIVMGFKGVSGQHCRLFIRDNQYALIDLGSSNGTLVNGTRIKRKMLHPKDIVQIGAEKFNVLLPPEAQEIAQRREQAAKADHVEADPQESSPEMPSSPTRMKSRKTASVKDRKAPRKPKTQTFTKPEESAPKSSSMLWLIIFFVGGVLGIALFVVGFTMKSASDTKIKELEGTIENIKRENTANEGNLNLIKEKLSEISDSFTELKTYVDDVSNKTYDVQRAVTSKIDEFSNNRTEINDRISQMQGTVNEIQQSIEEVNNK